MNQNGTELGLTIRMMREKKGMTRPELAEAAGISESHLKKVETGSRRPGIDTYQKIIRILGEDVIAGGGWGRYGQRKLCVGRRFEGEANSELFF